MILNCAQDKKTQKYVNKLKVPLYCLLNHDKKLKYFFKLKIKGFSSSSSEFDPWLLYWVVHPGKRRFESPHLWREDWKVQDNIQMYPRAPWKTGNAFSNSFILLNSSFQ